MDNSIPLRRSDRIFKNSIFSSTEKIIKYIKNIQADIESSSGIRKYTEMSRIFLFVTYLISKNNTFRYSNGNREFYIAIYDAAERIILQVQQGLIEIEKTKKALLHLHTNAACCSYLAKNT